MGSRRDMLAQMAARWSREADDAAKDLSALICSAGLVIGVEQIWMWPDGRVVEAEAWATEAAAEIGRNSGRIPQPPDWLLEEATKGGRR